MVVLAAAIFTKRGRVLLSRQFIPVGKSRVEYILDSFPKLLHAESAGLSGNSVASDGTGMDSTRKVSHATGPSFGVENPYRLDESFLFGSDFGSSGAEAPSGASGTDAGVGSGSTKSFFETKSVRYLFVPWDTLYLVLVTSKQSNVMQDLETLRLLFRLVRQTCGRASEETVSSHAFQLVFAMDELVSHGLREDISLEQVSEYLSMNSETERAYQATQRKKMEVARKAREAAQAELDRERQQREWMGLSTMGAGKTLGFGSDGISSDSYQRDDGNEGYSSSSSYGSSTSGSHKATGDIQVSRKAEQQTKKKSSSSRGGMRLGASSSGADDSAAAGGRGATDRKTREFLQSLQKEERYAADYDPLKRGQQIDDAAAAAGGGFSLDSESDVSEDDVSSGMFADGQQVGIQSSEKLECILTPDGESRLTVSGELRLFIQNPQYSRIAIQTSFKVPDEDNDDEVNIMKFLKLRLAPKMDKKLFKKQNILRAARPQKTPFPCVKDGFLVAKWTVSATDDTELLPVEINFWASNEKRSMQVSIDFSRQFSQVALSKCRMSFPLSSNVPPDVTDCSVGEWYFNDGMFVWNIGNIDDDEDSGSLEFSIPPIDESLFYPIEFTFHSNTPYFPLVIDSVTNLNEDADETDLSFSHVSSLEPTLFAVQNQLE